MARDEFNEIIQPFVQQLAELLQDILRALQ